MMYNDPIAGFFLILAAFIAFAGVLIIMATLVTRKAREYRRDMADLYVVGKIKQLAAKDNINLLEEFRQFQKFNKRKKIDYDEIDRTIEREMQEKISDEVEKTKKELK